MLSLLRIQQNQNKRITVLIDGEHYPEINKDSIQLLKDSFDGVVSGIIFMGGTEKQIIDDLEGFYGMDVFMVKNLEVDFLKALEIFEPDLVYDLSDVPVVNHEVRMKVASFCFSKYCSYMGPDFYFEYEPKTLNFSMPGILIIGTGKRVGKTAVSSYIAGVLSRNKDTAIIAMGRGGPRIPQVFKIDKTEQVPERLLEISRNGMHASSDYIEDAVFSRVTTIGCRRCGGGFGGKFFLSNISEGVKIVEKIKPDLVIVEGSGASVPPVNTERKICIIGADQKWESIIGYMGIYRILISDLVLLTMCEEPIAKMREIDLLTERILEIKNDIKIIRSVFRPKPFYDISNKKVFLTTTIRSTAGKKLKNYLEKEYNCEIVKISFDLADRTKLKKQLLDFKDYDVLLTELKAASVDLVTDFAFENNKAINYLNNIPVIIEGKEYFDSFIGELEQIQDARKK